MNKEEAINKAIRDHDSGYSSPIQIILSDLQMKIEEDVCEAVQRVGVNVDKDELIKALQYDREQYAKGFADGYAQGIEVGRNIVIAELNRITERKEEKNCGTCLNLQPWDGYCGLGFNKEAKEHGVCERWESK